MTSRRTWDFVTTDVREPDQVEALIGGIAERHGRLDVLVNNAGGAPPSDTATVSPRFSAGIIALNLTAPLVCAQKANAVMQAQDDGGTIINIASVSGIRPSPNTAAYGAAKAGLLNLTQTLAVEFAPKVRVERDHGRARRHRAGAPLLRRRSRNRRRRRDDPARPHGRPERRRRRVPLPRLAARALRQRRQRRRPRRRRAPRLPRRRPTPSSDTFDTRER